MNIELGIGIATKGRGDGTLPTHVIGLAGQSNMVGGPAFDGGAGWPQGTLQWGRNGASDGVIIPAAGNLQHQGGYGAGKMSLAIEFAIDYLAAHPGVRLLFVPGAEGGTSFNGGDWNKGDGAYADFVARMNAVFAQNPGFQLAGILWQHGEADAQDGAGSAYEASLDQMIVDLRADIARAGDMTPFVVGELPPEIADADASGLAVRAAQVGVGGRIAYTASAEATGLTTYDGVHLGAASLRTLGANHVAALVAAALNDGSAFDLLINGGFDDASEWVLGGSVGVAGGKGTVSGASGYWRQTGVPFEAGKTYQVSWTISGYSAGSTTPFFLGGGNNANGITEAGNGPKSQTLTANSGNTQFQLSCGGGSTLEIDDVSIVEV